MRMRYVAVLSTGCRQRVASYTEFGSLRRLCSKTREDRCELSGAMATRECMIEEELESTAGSEHLPAVRRAGVLFGLGMCIEEREYIRSPSGEHAAMITARDFDILVRHLQLFHLVDP